MRFQTLFFPLVIRHQQCFPDELKQRFNRESFTQVN